MNLALDMADRRGARAAARRLLELDPIGKGTLALAARVVLFSVPASESPTATGTPLSPAYSAATVTPGPTPQAGPASGTPPAGPASGTPPAAVPPPPPAAARTPD
jgi:hypothetical protein